jgi:glycosyltransferase involved in cell wall biosynthesis
MELMEPVFILARSTKGSIWRRKHGIPEDCVLVGFVGRLENAKGLQVLEEFCRLLPETKLHLLVQFLANNNAPSVSRGESIAKQLVSRNSAQVHVYRDQDFCVDRPIRHCDLMLSLSLSEVCPLTVLEALHCGIPVLATRSTPFYHELITLGFPHHLIRILEIEGISGTSGRNLSISEDAAKRLANSFITIASSLALSSDRDRKDTSEKIQSLGFDQQSMLGRLSAIYSQALSNQVG